MIIDHPESRFPVAAPRAPRSPHKGKEMEREREREREREIEKYDPQINKKCNPN